MNLDQRAEIYRNILAFRHSPGELFVGSPATLNALRAEILLGTR
jgi:hypothetical protein